jgi:LmbE family N-acetylglucosaminyl deacetylase
VNEAFERHVEGPISRAPRLLYAAYPKEIWERIDVDIKLDGVELKPNVKVAVGDYWDLKLAAPGLYASQKDAMWVADTEEQFAFNRERSHQVPPPLPDSAMIEGLWPAD